MSQSKSCLIAKLSHYVSLESQDEELLAALEKHARSLATGAEIHAGGDRMSHLYVVKSGWFYGYTHLPDGRRHVGRIYHEGDIIGFPTLAFEHHHINLRSASAGCLCPFEKQDLDVIFETAPRLTALLFTMSAREQVILMDKLRATSRMNPRARLAFLFLDFLCRLRITAPDTTDRFELPLTQSDIGDAIGLTNVTVSRIMGEMEGNNLIARADDQLVIKDEAALRALCDFEDRHSSMDTSWFPGGRARTD